MKRNIKEIILGFAILLFSLNLIRYEIWLSICIGAIGLSLVVIGISENPMDS